MISWATYLPRKLIIIELITIIVTKDMILGEQIELTNPQEMRRTPGLEEWHRTNLDRANILHKSVIT